MVGNSVLGWSSMMNCFVDIIRQLRQDWSQAMLCDRASCCQSSASKRRKERNHAGQDMHVAWRAKKRDSALRLPRIRRLRSAETISSSVRSGCAPMTARICRECFSKGEVLPPPGIGAHVPSSRKRCSHRIAELTLTSYCSAASGRDPPPSTKRITRTLSSPGYGPHIGQPSAESMR